MKVMQQKYCYDVTAKHDRIDKGKQFIWDFPIHIIFSLCFVSSSECEVLHGECIQTYVPYLFLVIPLGPVTLTGQVCCVVPIPDVHTQVFRTMCWWSLAVPADPSMPHLARILTLRILYQILART